jgi:hypothetical protein
VKLFLALLVAASVPSFDSGFALAQDKQEDLTEDFEGPVLEGWDRVVSDAHPPYNSHELVTDRSAAKSGSQFLRLQTQGGSTAMRRKPTRIDPARPYRLTAFARLNGTRRNAAAATLLWLNGDGEQVAETRSTPVSRPGGWTEISIDVARAPDGAIAVAPRFDFDGDDVRGTCDFDALVFLPVERLEVRPSGRTLPVFTADEFPRFTVSISGAAAGTHGVTLSMKSPGGTEIRRSAVLRIPDDTAVEIDLPQPGPGAHELTASIDGRPFRRTMTLLVPNPWISPRDSALPPALFADPVPPASEEILALAGLSSSTRERAAANGPLEAVLRARLARPADPVTIDGLFVDPEGRPTAALLALRATNDFLAGATPLPDPGLFPAPVRVAAFRKGPTAALALWSESGETELPVTLNDGARIYPPLGALRPLRPGERLRIGAIPTYLLGIDPLLLDLRLALSSPDLPLQLNPSTRVLRLHNPSRSQPLTGVRIQVVDVPAGWRISPMTMSAPRIAPEGELSESLQFNLPPAESERTQELKFDVTLDRGGKEQTLRVSRVVRLASVLSIDAAVADGPRPGSKKVTVRVTNASDRPMTLSLRARLPHLPEQNELLRDLAPGATSAPFEYVVKDVALTDPTHLTAEIDVQESLGGRATARKVVPLR